MDTLLFHDDIFRKKIKSKEYQPIHYANERIAQWTGTGPKITDRFLLDRIREYYEKSEDPQKMFWGQNKFAKLIKQIDQDYSVNYSSKKFHERWVWLRDYLGIESLPNVDDELIERLQLRYIIVHRAFMDLVGRRPFVFRGYFKIRRSIISVNYVLLNLLKQEGYEEHYKYFAEIKGFKSNMMEIIGYWMLIKKIISAEYKNRFYLKEAHYILDWKTPDITLEEIEASRIYD